LAEERTGEELAASADAERRIALATCAEIPDLDEDGPALVEALSRRGVNAVPAVWDLVGVDWSVFDLVVVRSTWDYAERRDLFLDWAASLPRVLNPLAVLRWNTDKHYLHDLARAGVETVPTRLVEPTETFSPPDGRFVVKPAISAGGRSSGSYERQDAADAGAHVRALQAEGRTVMIQPYLDAVDTHGETEIIYLGGRYSHAIRKGPLLPIGTRPTRQLYLEETIEAREPTADEREAAERAIAAVPFERSELLYGRVDLVPGDGRTPLVLEVELTEPSLYLGFAHGAPERLADAIMAELSRD
jgi:glutathione synthase/RimK-type ligase-like ATP-grasp enzyme